ncbi:DNA-directed RNA polymerase subunit D [Frankliniella fusca]|uniref:DNA-directed RNA polymerase subunit D n=1 Tax=Frankliniella fusca TaxID=407009 RepID=A0AAE1L860_9NEOP|nr:DNA-directed RNA polymerase subunit D [Frankliniella fusca]
MKRQDIIDFDSVCKGAAAPLCIRKMDTAGNPFLFGEAQWFRYEKKAPGIIKYKRSLREEEPFVELDWRSKKNTPLPKISPKQKVQVRCPISLNKKKDLLGLLDQIDPLYLQCYKDLPTSEEAVDKDPNLPPEFDVGDELLLQLTNEET